MGSDERLRRLERRAHAGDRDAYAALHRQRARSGEDLQKRHWLTVRLKKLAGRRRHAGSLARLPATHMARLARTARSVRARSLCGNLRNQRVRHERESSTTILCLPSPVVLAWQVLDDDWGICSKCWAGHLKKLRQQPWSLHEWLELIRLAGLAGESYPEPEHHEGLVDPLEMRW